MRPISSVDAMTAYLFMVNMELFKLLEEKVKELGFVGGLLYDFTSKPPGTIEWE